DSGECKLSAEAQGANGRQTTMDTRELGRGRKSPRNRVENELSLPEKSKRTGGMRGSRRGQEHPPARREFREIPCGTGSTPNGCWSSTRMETKARPNMTS